MIQKIFNYIFIFEAVCKAIAFGDSYFNYGWNKFDFFIVNFKSKTFFF